jgi:hypothetical protein
MHCALRQLCNARHAGCEGRIEVGQLEEREREADGWRRRRRLTTAAAALGAAHGGAERTAARGAPA